VVKKRREKLKLPVVPKMLKDDSLDAVCSEVKLKSTTRAVVQEIMPLENKSQTGFRPARQLERT
jgi:hypothetical protein